jgi:hypothetical protein
MHVGVPSGSQVCDFLEASQGSSPLPVRQNVVRFFTPTRTLFSQLHLLQAITPYACLYIYKTADKLRDFQSVSELYRLIDRCCRRSTASICGQRGLHGLTSETFQPFISDFYSGAGTFPFKYLLSYLKRLS